MKKLLTFTLLLLIIISGNAQIEFDIKYGALRGKNKKIDSYTYYDNIHYDGDELDPVYSYGLTLKYFFTKNIYSGLQLDLYKMSADGIARIELEDSRYSDNTKYINTLFAVSEFSRNRLNTSFFAGYKIKYGFYVEAGATYMKNNNNQLGGQRYDDFEVDSNFILTDLSTFILEDSHNFAFVAGIGWRLKTKKGLCLMVDYRYFFEQHTKFEDDSDFALKYHTQIASIGIGYYFDFKKSINE